jgi:hypothetical protein
MTYELTPGLIDVGGILVENYQRDSLATSEAKVSLGLDPTKTIKAGIGIAAINEYIVLDSGQLQLGGEIVFETDLYGVPMQLVSLYVDAPQNKNVQITIRDGGGLYVVFDQLFLRTSTPYAFPDCPLSTGATITALAVDSPAKVRLVFKPCAILPIIAPIPPR